MCISYNSLKPYQEASRETSSTPLCNIGLNRRVNGNGTLAVKSKENVYSVSFKNHQPSSMNTLRLTVFRFLICLTICFVFDNFFYLLVKKPENAQLIHPPITIIGNTFVTLPFSMSVIMEGSAK